MMVPDTGAEFFIELQRAEDGAPAICYQVELKYPGVIVREVLEVWPRVYIGFKTVGPNWGSS